MNLSDLLWEIISIFENTKNIYFLFYKLFYNIQIIKIGDSPNVSL